MLLRTILGKQRMRSFSPCVWTRSTQHDNIMVVALFAVIKGKHESSRPWGRPSPRNAVSWVGVALLLNEGLESGTRHPSGSPSSQRGSQGGVNCLHGSTVGVVNGHVLRVNVSRCRDGVRRSHRVVQLPRQSRYVGASHGYRHQRSETTCLRTDR